MDNIFNREEFLANLKALLAAARRQKIPVVYTKITPLPAGYQSGWGIYQAMKRFGVDDPSKIPVFMKPGSPEAEISAALTPVEGEVVLNKHSASIFFGTNFEHLMRFRGIQTILFTGIATEYGIEHSAREGCHPRLLPGRSLRLRLVDRQSSARNGPIQIMLRMCLEATSKEIKRSGGS